MHLLYLVLLSSVAKFWYCFNKTFTLLQSLVWLINGTYFKRWDGEKRANSKNSGHVMRVVWRWRIDDYLSEAQKEDFLLTHEGFQPPEYVLQDHISLYKVTADEAIFVEVKRGEDVWKCEHSPPFMAAAQFLKAIKVIRLPVAALHYLSDRVGDPVGKIILISNSSRCGSTLLNQMFEATDKIITFGEPNCINVLTSIEEAELEKRRQSSDSGKKHKEDEQFWKQFDQLVVSTVRLLCKPTSLNPIASVIKLTATGAGMITKRFPNCYNYYLYRDCLKVAQSLAKFSDALPLMHAMYRFGKNSKENLKFYLAAQGLPEQNFDLELKYDLSIGVMIWGVFLNMYYGYRKDGLNIKPIRFEDMMANPVEFMRRIYRDCGLPESLAEKALDALKRDSQKDTPFSTKALLKFSTRKYEGDCKLECDWVCDQLNIPRLNIPFIIPNTISIIDT